MNYLNEPLYRAILADPACDTARVVFADWLDEQSGEWVPCRECDGSGWRRNHTHVPNRGHECPTCHGTGTIRDTSLRDRAGFIRLQIDQPGNLLHQGVIDAHHEWLKQECPKMPHLTWNGCPVCHGTGDLLRYPGRYGLAIRNPTLRRGFVDEVSCRLEELGREECPTCGGYGNLHSDMHCTENRWKFIPSPWALAVVRSLPCTRFRIEDKRPLFPEYGPVFRWWRGGEDSYALPGWLFDLLPHAPAKLIRDGYVDYDSEETALDALAVAAAMVVRKHAFPKETE